MFIISVALLFLIMCVNISGIVKQTQLQATIDKLTASNDELKKENSLLKTEKAELGVENAKLKAKLDFEEKLKDNEVEDNDDVPPENGITYIARHIIFLYNELGYDYNTEYYTGELRYVHNDKDVKNEDE